MKARFGDFTRGSQLIETFSLMFAAGLKPMLWVTGTMFSVMLGWMIWHDMTPDDLYRCIMRGYAWFWEYLKLDPAKLVAVVGTDGEPVKRTIGSIATYPPVKTSWQLLLTTIAGAAKLTVLLGLPLCFGYTWISRRIGNRALRRNHERGATLARVSELIARINAYNAEAGRAERRAFYERRFGRWWWLSVPCISRDDLVAEGMYLPYSIAGVPYPWRVEQSHMFAVGTTGTGKSTMMRELLGQVRARGKKAVVFDLTGTYVESFYDPKRDIILNPFDERCPQWSIFNDCETRAEFTAAAEALIPSDGGGAEPFWVQAARLLFIEACVRLAQHGHRTNEALHDHLMVAALKQVNELMQGSVAAPLTDPAAARMAESIRATLNTNINAIECLPNDGEFFSIKEWVKAEQSGGSILFIASRHVDLPTIKVLLTLWMDMAINSMMSLPTSPRDIRIWFLFDEVGALHRLPAIEKGMQTARNYGGAFVLGVHTIAKLRDTYGDKIAETLGSLARTKLILATADYASAQWCSQQIGNGEWRQMEEGYSYGYSNVRDAVTLTNKRQLEPLVLPDDITKLPDLTGWLVFPQDMPAAKVRLTYRDWPRAAPGFVARTGIKGPTQKIGGSDADEIAAADGVGINVERTLTRIGRMMDADGITDLEKRTAYGRALRNVESINAQSQHRTATLRFTLQYGSPTSGGARPGQQLGMDFRATTPPPAISPAVATGVVAAALTTPVVRAEGGAANRDAAARNGEAQPPGLPTGPRLPGAGLPLFEANAEDLSLREAQQNFVSDEQPPRDDPDLELGA
ncbi:MAG: type IV secretion system DNA-binding domain-containing protein [Sphingomonas sp.]